MGDYTDDQKFYLIDSDELVSVDSDLNYNLQRADERVRSLVEYQITDQQSVSGSTLAKDEGFKWYKTYSNSIFVYRDGGVFQDPNSKVDDWSFSGIAFETGYSSADVVDNRISYSVFNGFVRFRGALVLDNKNTDFPLNTVVNFMSVPTSILPKRQRYFFVHGGNATGTDFQTFRIFIPNADATDKRWEYIKYGATASSMGERYLSLCDIYYPLVDD